MFALAAVVLGVLAGLSGFGVVAIDAAGLLGFAVACLAVHLAWPWSPWQRPG
jgi:hypothetical protein